MFIAAAFVEEEEENNSLSLSSRKLKLSKVATTTSQHHHLSLSSSSSSSCLHLWEKCSKQQNERTNKRCGKQMSALVWEPNHQRWRVKMEAQSEHVSIAHAVSQRLAPDLHAQSVLADKIPASELRRKFIKSALLVGRGKKRAIITTLFLEKTPKKVFFVRKCIICRFFPLHFGEGRGGKFILSFLPLDAKKMRLQLPQQRWIDSRLFSPLFFPERRSSFFFNLWSEAVKVKRLVSPFWCQEARRG